MPKPEYPIQSVLETIRIDCAQRQVIYQTDDLFEAPNWSRCGQFFVINQDGCLYRVTLDGSTVTRIDTGFANSCNNDHGISPDGDQLVISHHDQSHNHQSHIYCLPIKGGTPHRVTEQAPSYWHGWSPDGARLAYVAGRGGDYKIYSISVDGGSEQQLTFGPGLDDGPDYSPDGRHIYYNSFRHGRMQIWRMNADGSHPKQMVKSEHSDWFPHPSPDGRNLVFLRYLKDQGQAHPFGQDVQLMLLDLVTDQLRPLTDVFFGGQGTINVPSWSPDGQQLAFVSYLRL